MTAIGLNPRYAIHSCAIIIPLTPTLERVGPGSDPEVPGFRTKGCEFLTDFPSITVFLPLCGRYESINDIGQKCGGLD